MANRILLKLDQDLLKCFSEQLKNRGRKMRLSFRKMTDDEKVTAVVKFAMAGLRV